MLSRLNRAKAEAERKRGHLYAWINILDNLKDEEQDYYDNIPENLQYSQRAEDSEAAIDNLDEALDLLNDAWLIRQPNQP